MIISFDPGDTTGYCAGDSLSRNFSVLFAGTFYYTDRFAFVKDLLGLNAHLIEYIIIEDFRLRESAAKAMIGNRFVPVKVIDTIELWAYEYSLFDRIVFQQPAQRNSAKIIPPLHAEQLQKYNRHCVDAYRHLRYFIFTKTHQSRKGV